MLFSYNWLQSFFKEKLPKPEKLAELLSIHSFEIEEVKKVGKDFVLDIDVLPNRAHDCLGYFGIARECAVLTKSKRKKQKSKIIEDKNLKTNDFILVENKNKKVCLRYTTRVVAGVKVGSSPKWIKERLKICGIKSINNIVDITNYVMLELGQPLHAFDYDKLKIKKIIVRKAKRKEKIITLDGIRKQLDEKVLVIADIEKPIAIAGVMGGQNSQIDKNTKTIILESANFDRLSIYKTSKKLNLRTESSIRFEQGIDPNLTEQAINQAAQLIQKIAGGKITQGLIDIYPKKVVPKRIKLDLDYVEKLLGVKIPKKEIKNILKRLEFKCIESGSQNIMVEVPTFRLDISIPEDLIEEIGRIYGYQNIPAFFPFVSLIPPKRNEEIFWEDMIKNILKEAGFTEVYNYSFISEANKEIFNYSQKDLIEIENPVSIEQKYLRPSLIINLIRNIKENLKRFKEIKIFELGKTYKKSKKVEEKRMLTGVITDEAFNSYSEFYRLKGLIDLLLQKLGISNIWYDDYKPVPKESKISFWHPQRCAEIKINHERIGFLGEISPKILEKMKITKKLVVFNLDFEKLLKLVSEEHEYQPLSHYPSAVRDLAILVPGGTKVVEVLNKINIAGGSLVRDVDIFDIYEGEELPEGKKNLAFHIIYQAENRTLSSKEIDKLQQKIIKVLEENPEWEVRI